MKEISTRINVNDLFDQINQLCSIPFSKLEPLNLKCSNKEKQLNFDLLRGLRKNSKSKASSSDINERKLPKTHSEVEDLFSEIGDFCRINLPFKLNDLDEDDRIDENPDKETTLRVQLSQSKNKRIPLKSQELNKNGSSHSFAKLMFNFSAKCTNNSNLKCDKKLERSTRVTRSRTVQNISCKKNEIKLASSKKISPLCLSSSFDLKSSLKSCRSYISLMKTNENKIVDDECAVKKRKTSKKKSIALISKDDSLESGYSSSQSSVPSSPAASLLSADLEESNKSSLSSNCSTSTNSSLTHNINPNGEIIYIRSQVDFYLDKTSKRKRKAISCDKQNQPYQVPNNVDHHQKVIEWQCKTLLNNSCPTPQHDHFEDTPPHSPVQSLSCHATDDNNNNPYDDQLDLDCLQDLCGTVNDNQAFQDDLDLDLMLQQYQECGSNLDYAYPLDIDSILS